MCDQFMYLLQVNSKTSPYLDIHESVIYIFRALLFKDTVESLLLITRMFTSCEANIFILTKFGVEYWVVFPCDYKEHHRFLFFICCSFPSSTLSFSIVDLFGKPSATAVAANVTTWLAYSGGYSQ